MHRATKSLLAVAGGGLALWTAWGLYTRAEAERVEYTTLETVDGVELRRYPRSVLAETTATSDNEAFRRLFRYISGENDAGSEISMTAPVETRDRRSESIEMTAPVRTTPRDSNGDGVTMGFYLPRKYDANAAPTPTDPAVKLLIEGTRDLAVVRFSWYATEGRVERKRQQLLQTLDDTGIETSGEPFVLRYNDPWTPPFMRRNEVAVEVEVE